MTPTICFTLPPSDMSTPNIAMYMQAQFIDLCHNDQTTWLIAIMDILTSLLL